MLARLLLAAFLLGHALIHAGFVLPRPPATAGGPVWPFTLDQSWALRPLRIHPARTRLLGMGLAFATIGGLGLAAVTVLGLLPAAAWSAGVTTGALASVALLLLFFHRRLVLGVAIDLFLIWAVLIAGWVPDWQAG